MKRTRLLSSIIIGVTSLVGTVAVACGNDKAPAQKKDGVETGVYYYDSIGGSEYLLSLYGGDKATLVMENKFSAGTYSKKQDEINIKFNSTDLGTLSAVFDESNGIVTLTYNDVDMRFLRRIDYTVKYDSNEGSSVNDDVVINGKTLAKPEDPVRDGYTFVGWYIDENFKSPFMFGTQPVVADTTLYAQWVRKEYGKSEYTIKFDAGEYDGAPSIESKTTVSGKLYDFETPERDNYTFKGWWYSMSGKRDELTYVVTTDTVFTESTTLYALWQGATEGQKLPAPIVNINQNNVSWEPINGASSYRVEVTGPSGFDTITQNPSETNINVRFTNPGDYTIKVSAVSSASAEFDSDVTVRHYRYKALSKVSLFSFVEPSTLLFNEVEHAEKYLIYIDCGDKGHNHAPFDNGKSTNFNFANCAMQDGGIKFKVEAVAEGYASSISEEHVFNKTLEKISGLNYDAQTQTVSWAAVPYATNYVVSVNCGISDHDHKIVDIGNKTSYSVKECEQKSGGITVNVYPRTKGYNSPVPTSITFEKTIPATPRNIKIVGNKLRWTPVSGENIKYSVNISDTEYLTETNELDLSQLEDFALEQGKDYMIRVKAVMENGSESVSSIWSDQVDARCLALYSTMSYSRNTVSWRHVVGVSGYHVRVNGDNGSVQKITDGSNCAKVVLTQSGINKIEVRYFIGEESNTSDWVSLNVRAYAMTFDTRGGVVAEDGACAPRYYAVGDEVSLPDNSSVTQLGFELDGWYNAPGGAYGNGARYTDKTFVDVGDIVLYANWKSKEYKVTLDYNNGGDGIKEVTVEYGKEFKLPMPTTTLDATTIFGGWCTTASGDGIMLTDVYGESSAAWRYDGNRTVYARWIAALQYEKIEGGDAGYYYMAKAGKNGSGAVRSITVPEKYQGSGDVVAYPVTQLSKDVFIKTKYPNLEVINIPATIDTIAPETFRSAAETVKEIHVYDVAGIRAPVFWSDADGVIYYNNETTSAVQLWFFPCAKTGEYTISDRVTDIGERAFYYSPLDTLNIPASVSRIDSNAFSSTKIKNIVFLSAKDGEPAPRGVTIFKGAFDLASSIESIHFPSHKIFIADKKTENVITNEKIDYYCDLFYGTTKLKSITVEQGNPDYKDIDGLFCANDVNSTLLYVPRALTGETVDEVDNVFTIPQGIFSIGKRAFSGCTYIHTVIIPNWVMSIQDGAFSGYNGVIPSGSTSGFNPCGGALANGGLSVIFKGNAASAITIGDRAFGSDVVAHAAKYKSVVFEPGCMLTHIGKYAFANGNLKNLKIPKTVALIDESAFEGSQFDEVEYEENGVDLSFEKNVFRNCTLLETMYFPANVIKIGDGIFSGCKVLREVVVAEENERYATFDGVLFGNLLDDKGSPVLDETGKAILDIIIYYPAGKTDGFTLPSSITKIGGGLFKNNKDIPGITIHENVTYIGAEAFYGCTNLSEVIIADGNKALEICAGAFYGCTNLSTITVPSRVDIISDDLFNGCKLLNTVYINGDITSIGERAFKDCATLNKIIKSDLTQFEGSSEIPNLIYIPYTVTKIGDEAFLNCSAVTRVYFAEQSSVVAEGDQTQTVANPYTIGNSAFANCGGLININLRVGLTEIGERAYEKCTSLKNINIPYTVKVIGTYAFSGCTDLAIIAFDNTPLDENEEHIVRADIAIGSFAMYGCSSLTEVILPSGLDRISESCFENCVNLQTVYIPSTVSNDLTWQSGSTAQPVAVGDRAFYGCVSLHDVIFEPGDGDPLSLGHNAFYGCTNLTEINLPKRLQDAKDKNGKDASALGESFWSGAVQTGFNKTIYTAFAMCENLSAVHIEDGGKYYKSDANGLVYKLGEFTYSEYVYDEETDAYVDTVRTESDGVNLVYVPFAIGDTVTVANDCTLINDMLFQGKTPSLGGAGFYKKIKNFVFEDGGTADLRIGNGTNTTTGLQGSIFNCTGVEEINFPSRVVSIGNQAFAKCNSLKKVTFDADSRLKEIRMQAFSKCQNLQYIEFPANLEVISESAFEMNKTKTSALINLRFGNGAAKVDDSGNALKDINGNTIYEVDEACKLKTIMTKAFYGTGITSFVIPNSVETLGESIFESCRKLNTVTLSRNLKVFDNAFNGCKAVIQMPEGGGINFDAIDGGVIYSKDKTTLLMYPVGKRDETYTVPYGIEEIATGAFAGNKFIKKVFIPNTVSKIGEQAFLNCYALEEVEFESDSVIHTDEDGNNIPIAQSLTVGITNRKNNTSSYPSTPSASSLLGNSHVFRSCESLKRVNFPKRTVSVGRFTFYNCLNLEEVTFESGCEMQVMEALMFANCSKLRTVTLPDGLERLGVAYNTSTEEINNNSLAYGAVFSNCTALQSITLPNTLKYISKQAFYNCGITSIVIPANVERIGVNAFENCLNLKTVEFARGSNLEYFVYLDTGVSDEDGNSYIFQNCSALESVILPYSLLSLGKCAFKNCESLTTVKYWNGSGTSESVNAVVGLPTNLKYIGQSSFFNTALGDITGAADPQTVLSTLNIPSSVYFIGQDAFLGTKIKEVRFAEGENVVIEAGSKSTGGVFNSCTLLEKVDFGGRTIKSGTAASAVNVLGKYTFYNCTALEQVINVSDALKTIDQYAFYGCTALKDFLVSGDSNTSGIIIPGSVTIINKAAFAQTGIETVKLLDGSNILQIVNGSVDSKDVCAGVFAQCPLLKTVDMSKRKIKASKDNYLGMYMFYQSGLDVSVVDGKGFTVILPDSLTNIDNYSFAESGLTDIEITASVKSIEKTAFVKCTKLTGLTFESRSLSIAFVNGLNSNEGAFNGCTALTSVVLPDHLSNTGNYTFYGCTSLKNINLGSATTVGNYSFYGCTALTDINYGTATNVTIGSYSFANTGVVNLVVGDNVKVIGASAFRNCGNLSSIVFEDGVLNEIGNDAFTSCVKLTAVEIPSTVTTIGLSPFASCVALASVTVAAENETFISFEDGVYNSDKSVLYFFATGKAVEFVLPEETVEIRQGAFFGGKITKLTIHKTGESEVEIAQYTFQNCQNLAEIDINCKISVGYSAFGYCDALTVAEKTVLGNDCVLADNAFRYCENLEGITAPDKIVMSLTAFNGCDKFNNKNISDIADFTYSGYKVDSTGAVIITSSTNKIAADAFKGNTDLTSVVLAEGITHIGANAFEDCVNLKNIKLPSTLIEIGKLAFYNSGLTGSLTIPASVTDIKNAPFAGTDISSVIFEKSDTTLAMVSGGSLTVVGSANAFGYMEELVSVDFNQRPFKNNSMPGFMFVGSTKLKEVKNISQSVTALQNSIFAKSGLESFVIPNEWATITSAASTMFTECENLKTVTFPNDMPVIKWTSMFKNCTSLTSVTLPSNLTVIPANTFEGCTALTNITLPNTLDNIGEGAFRSSGLYGMLTVPSSVTFIGKSAFSGTAISSVEFEASDEVLTLKKGGGYTTIGSVGAFGMMSELQSVNFNGRKLDAQMSSSTTITSETLADYTFACDPKLTSVTNWSNEVKSIGPYAFYGAGFTTFTMPETCNVSVGNYAFAECVNLKVFNAPNHVNNVKNENQYYYLGTHALKNTAIENFDVPEGVLAVAPNLFMGCEKLKSVTLPSTLKNVRSNSFEGCISLTSIDIPEGVEWIYASAFLNCTSLTHITIPTTLTKIMRNAFEGCTVLTDVVLYEGIDVIEADAFVGWTANQRIYVVGNIARPDGWVSGWNSGATVVWDYSLPEQSLAA